ncbi:MAG: alkaline phosphatase family protein [Peptococcaceae bacterium]|nr:alkaline phosphatase family protein [Peptococcaceae bacterium]
MARKTEKLMVLGIDGMDPKFTKYLVEKGEMPAVKTLIERGACREDLVLLGGMPTITPPMWTTLSTGAYASTHGITGFWNVDSEDHSKLVYGLDSTTCRAEQSWNGIAEAGYRTLVFHWPGSSWPPTSDSPNLAVVDGVQPGFVGFGTGMRDDEVLVTASVKVDVARFLPKAGTNNTGAGCILSDVDIKEASAGAKASEDACANAGASVSNVMLTLEDGEFSIENAPYNTSNAPLKAAEGWAIEVPADAKEFTVVLCNGLQRRPCLLLKNEAGEYDTVAMYRSKKDETPLAITKYHEFSPFYLDEVILEDGSKVTCARNIGYVYHDDNYETINLWINRANDITDDAPWHPKSLHQEIIDNVGYWSFTSSLGGKNTYFSERLMLPTWEIYNNWQAACLKYFIDNDKYDVIFSHLHNVDGIGHNIWPHGHANHHTDSEDIEKNHELMAETYRQTDRYLAQFLQYLDEGWTIILTSDHGLICDTNEEGPALMGDAFGVNAKIMNDMGLTVLKRDEEGNILKEIDWEKTKAVATGTNHIFLNIKGRDPFGIVEPEDQYALEEEIINALYGYRDPATGRRIISLAVRNEDALVFGMGQEGMGDIIYFLEDGFHRVHGDSWSTRRDHAGYHTSVSPIFVAAGAGIKKGFYTDRVIRQVDVAPTICTLLDVRMPAQCEGAPVYQIIED